MNELRMYVERLFEGKVLTKDTIELKEEIYGNLVARYEDYVASGVSEAEALQKTKASITSIEDVLAEQNESLGAGDKTAQDAASSMDAVSSMDATSNMNTAGNTDSADGTGSIVTADATNAVGAHKTPRKRWMYVVGAVAAVFLLGMLVVAGINVFKGTTGTRSYEQALTSQASTGNTSNQSNSNTQDNQSSSAATTDSTATTTTESLPTDRLRYDIYIDANGNLRYDDDYADELIYAIVESSYTDVATFVGTSLSDTTATASFVASLPMGEWFAALNASSGGDVLSYSYNAVPEHCDDDSVEAALAYNATAIFCAMSDVSRIAIAVSESDDPYDYDYYVFDRTVVETLYGISLTSDLVNEAGWQQLKVDNLYASHFIESMIDRAER